MTAPADEPAPPEELRLLLHAYVDGELDAANARAVARKIAADPALARELAATEALRQALREQLPPEPLPPGLQSRIERVVGARPAASMPGWTKLAASLLLGIAIGGGSTLLATRHSAWEVQDEGVAPTVSVVDNHMRALMSGHMADVASSERHTVKPWFNGRIAQSPRVPDLGAQGFPLIGGRIDVIDATPVPTIVYGRRLHVISVSALRDGAPAKGIQALSPINGYNLVSWSDGDVSYLAASDLNAAELRQFAELFAKAP